MIILFFVIVVVIAIILTLLGAPLWAAVAGGVIITLLGYREGK